VPGVTVSKWTRLWAERFPRIPLELVALEQTDQRLALDEDRVDMCFVRLPLAEGRLHLIPLYEETPVVIVSKDHPVALFDGVDLADLSDENVLDPTNTLNAIDLAAGGAGVLFAPQSIARSHSRRDLVHRPVRDARPTQISLAWRVDHPNELIEDFIGIVRGRTVNSSRSAQAQRTTSPLPASKPPTKAAASKKAPGQARGAARKRPGPRRGR
jgi:DNA-binding transcriptional LysR family regulator